MKIIHKGVEKYAVKMVCSIENLLLHTFSVFLKVFSKS